MLILTLSPLAASAGEADSMSLQQEMEAARQQLRAELATTLAAQGREALAAMSESARFGDAALNQGMRQLAAELVRHEPSALAGVDREIPAATLAANGLSQAQRD